MLDPHLRDTLCVSSFALLVGVSASCSGNDAPAGTDTVAAPPSRQLNATSPAPAVPPKENSAPSAHEADPAAVEAGTPPGHADVTASADGDKDDVPAPSQSEATENEPAGPTVKQMLASVKKKKTGDAAAHDLLQKAQKHGATPRQLAEAANTRGESLMTTPERASDFFEWARKTDDKFPDATFNLAKLAANRGEIPKVKELLTEVAARGGKKMLDTIEFDPTFALVADDRDIAALK